MKSEVRSPGLNSEDFVGRIFILSNDPEEKAMPNLTVARELAKQAAIKGETCAIFGLRVPGVNQFTKRAVMCSLWNRDVDGEVVEVWEPEREHINRPGVFFPKRTKIEGSNGH
jgi:hypothetical protein